MSEQLKNTEAIEIFKMAIATIGKDDGEAYMDRVVARANELAQAISTFTREQETNLGTMTLTGKLVSVENPYVKADGKVLNLAYIQVDSDQGDKRYLDGIWIDLTTEAGRRMAQKAERLSGSRVVVVKSVKAVFGSDGKRVINDNGHAAKRSTLVSVEAESKVNGRTQPRRIQQYAKQR